MKKYDAVVIGAGWAGIVCARELAEQGYRVLILEKRMHIGGNMYDYYDKYGLLIHKYGPHIMMTDNENILKYIERYDSTIPICVKMETSIDGKIVPLPINLNSIKELYGINANTLIDELLNNYGKDEEINVLDLLESQSVQIHRFGEDIYKKIFYGYNVKMWGGVKHIDKNVIGRAPIRLSNDDIRSKRKYNFVPEHGYSKLFEKILSHSNIELQLNIDGSKKVNIDNKLIYFNGSVFGGKVYYTAPIDELCNFCFGKLEYRSIYFKKHYVNENREFSGLAVTYPSELIDKIRTSDMSRVTGIFSSKRTVLVDEYSGNYNEKSVFYNVPSYPVLSVSNIECYKKYQNLLKGIKNFYVVGRLAEYRYYDMSQVIENSLEITTGKTL